MHPRGGAEEIKGLANIGHPVANRFVDRILERFRAGCDRTHFRAEQLHPEDVERLPGDIDLAHVDDAIESEQRAGGRRSHAVLTGAGFGDDPLLAHSFRQQCLAERVVDLVGAGVGEILTLQIDARAAGRISEIAGEIDRRRTPDVVASQPVDFPLKRRIAAGFDPGSLEFFERRHQRFRRVLAAEATVAPLRIRPLAGCGAFAVANEIGRHQRGTPLCVGLGRRREWYRPESRRREGQ